MSKIKLSVFNSFRSFLKIPFFEKLLVSAMFNTNGNFLVSKLIPNHYQYKNKTIRIANINGIILKLDLSEYLSHFLYYRFKDLSMNELIKVSKNKKNIFDVGANIGYTSLLMGKANHSKSNVYAFEPDPNTYQNLLHNLKLNKISSIYPYNLGIGKKESREKLVVSQNGNLGENSINNNAKENFNWITLTSIDLFCVKNNVDKIDLIKIDVEGYEYNVLKGAEKTINKDKPVLFVEIIDEKLKSNDSSSKEVISFIERYYSNIYDVATKERVTSKDNFLGREIDIVAMN